MSIPKILWMEDQYQDFNSYISKLYREGYWIEPVKTITDALKKMREEYYIAYIFDIKVLPGTDSEWIKVDQDLRRESPNFDPNLGLEMMRSLFKSSLARNIIEPLIVINPEKVIVLSVVFDKKDEIVSFGIPRDQIIYKGDSDMNTLPELIGRIIKRDKND